MEKIDLKIEKKKKKEEEKIKLKEDSLKLPTKKIIYKGKEKEIPIHNPDTNKCEFYIIKNLNIVILINIMEVNFVFIINQMKKKNF